MSIYQSAAKEPTPINLVLNTKTNQLPIEEIYHMLDNVLVEACVELTRRLLAALLTLPTGVARSRSNLQTVVLFIVEYGSTVQEDNHGESPETGLLER